MSSSSRSAVVIACLVVAFCIVGSAQAAEFERQHSIKADELLVRNLIGRIEIDAASGSTFEVVVNVQGADADQDRVGIEISEGRLSSLTVEFPISESRRYVYPRLGSGKVTFSSDSGWLSELLGANQIKVAGSGRGLEVWADITVRVPRGSALRVDHGAGEVVARNIEGELDLSTHAGGIEIERSSGKISADTGSGKITLAEIRGNLSADTGSGRVNIREFEGDDLNVDTGSGRVEAERIEARSIGIDTGSGRVSLIDVGTDDLSVDTGSGSVKIVLVRMGSGRFNVDTGSGSIDLRVPEDASAKLSADTGSGGVSVDANNARIMHQEKDEVELVLADGSARVDLSTGSGAIRISQR